MTTNRDNELMDGASEKASQTRMLARDEHRRKEHDEQMEWHRKQQRR